MQKGFITLSVITIIVLALSLIAGSSYTYYKINKIQQENSDVVTELEEKIEKLAPTANDSVVESEIIEMATSSDLHSSSSSETASDSKKNNSLNTTNAIQTETQTTPALSLTPVDVCTNINGIQAFVPSDHKLTGGICIKLEDKCSNIDGIQEIVPSDMLVFKEYGCMTDREMDKIQEANRELNEQKELVKQCKNLSDEIQDLQADYATYSLETESYVLKIQNTGGGLSSGVQAEINNYRNSRLIKDTELQNEINLKLSQYNLEC